MILSATRRITGNLLPAAELLAARTAGATRVRPRAEVAYGTAIHAIAKLAERGDRPVVVYYFSGGYDLGSVPEPQPLIAAAWQAGVALHAFHIWEDASRIVPALPPGTTAGQWDEYGWIALDSLRMLAGRTGGMTIDSDHDLETALGQLLP